MDSIMFKAESMLTTHLPFLQHETFTFVFLKAVYTNNVPAGLEF